MNQPNFHQMSPEAFEAYHPGDEDEIYSYEKEADFRQWCREQNEDPIDRGARDSYAEYQSMSEG